jgi:hypothetical protein
MALPTLRQGSQGESVKYLQERLNKNGFHLKADGDFGPGTDAAVEQFQASHGLTADGVVGARTWDALLVETSATPPPNLAGDEKTRLLGLIPADAPTLVKKVLTLAINDLGKKEIPNGSNAGPEIDHLVHGYNQYWWVLKAGVSLSTIKARGYPLESECVPPMAWCAMAVANWIRLGLSLPAWDHKSGAGTPLPGHPFVTYLGGAAQIEEWGQKLGRWEVDNAQPCPAGAAFTIARAASGSDPSSSPKAGHIGLVIYDNGDGTVETVEGNVSNKVNNYTRKKKDLRGWTTWW